jgi:hypothetical protein
MQKTTIAAFIFGFTLLTITAGCNDRGREANIGPEERPDRPAAVSNANRMNNNLSPAAADTGNVTVADITGGDWNNYAGKTVTVSGWVERTYGTNSFRLDEDLRFHRRHRQ